MRNSTGYLFDVADIYCRQYKNKSDRSAILARLKALKECKEAAFVLTPLDLVIASDWDGTGFITYNYSDWYNNRYTHDTLKKVESNKINVWEAMKLFKLFCQRVNQHIRMDKLSEIGYGF